MKLGHILLALIVAYSIGSIGCSRAGKDKYLIFEKFGEYEGKNNDRIKLEKEGKETLLQKIKTYKGVYKGEISGIPHTPVVQKKISTKFYDVFIALGRKVIKQDISGSSILDKIRFVRYTNGKDSCKVNELQDTITKKCYMILKFSKISEKDENTFEMFDLEIANNLHDAKYLNKVIQEIKNGDAILIEADTKNGNWKAIKKYFKFKRGEMPTFEAALLQENSADKVTIMKFENGIISFSRNEKEIDARQEIGNFRRAKVYKAKRQVSKPENKKNNNTVIKCTVILGFMTVFILITVYFGRKAWHRSIKNAQMEREYKKREEKRKEEENLPIIMRNIEEKYNFDHWLVKDKFIMKQILDRDFSAYVHSLDWSFEKQLALGEEYATRRFAFPPQCPERGLDNPKIYAQPNVPPHIKNWTCHEFYD